MTLIKSFGKLLGLALLITFFLSGCATSSTRLVDPQGRDEAQKVIDDRQCSIVIGYGSGPIIDATYYDACMIKKGYTKQRAEGTDYLLFTSWTEYK